MAANSPLTLFEDWIPKDQDCILCILYSKSESKDLITIANKYENVKEIQVLGSPEIIPSLSNKIVSYNEKTTPQYPLYIYINLSPDGKETSKTLKTQSKNKETGAVKVVERTMDSLFSKSFWRKSCYSLFLNKYSGDYLINNYWMIDPKNPFTNDYSISVCYRSMWAKMCQELPSVPEVKGNTRREIDPNWIVVFTKYIRVIMSYIVEPEYIDIFVSPTNMDMWIRTLIHKTYNLIYNYEPIEYFGDAASKYVFREYMNEKYPKFTARELTEFSAQYMSREYQQIFSDDLNLTKWGLYNPITTTTSKTKTDILESFTGALTVVGNLIGPGVGDRTCYNLYLMLGESLPFPEYMSYGLPITQVSQMNQQMGFSKDDPFNMKRNNLIIRNGGFVKSVKQLTVDPNVPDPEDQKIYNMLMGQDILNYLKGANISDDNVQRFQEIMAENFLPKDNDNEYDEYGNLIVKNIRDDRAFAILTRNGYGNDTGKKVYTMVVNPDFYAYLMDKKFPAVKIGVFQEFVKSFYFTQTFNENVQETDKEIKSEMYLEIFNAYGRLGITQEFIASLHPDLFRDVMNIDRDIINRLKIQLENVFSKDTDAIHRVRFYEDITENIIIMYLDIYQQDSQYYGINTLVAPTKIKTINLENLSVVKFIAPIKSSNGDPIMINGRPLTNVHTWGRYRAILTFLREL